MAGIFQEGQEERQSLLMIDKIKFLPEGLGIDYKFSICFSKFKISFSLQSSLNLLLKFFRLKVLYYSKYINFETQEY